MKYLLFIPSFLLLINCVDKTDNNTDSVIGKAFQNFKKFKVLSAYTKISDTIIYDNNIEAKHGVLHLENSKQNLILFNRISRNSSAKRIYKVLDTLVILKRDDSTFVTIGYCEINDESDENLIAVVKKTDSLKIKDIAEVWRANTASEKIERLNHTEGIDCFSEWFEGY